VMRILVRLSTVLALVAAVLMVPTAGSTPTGTAQAADTSQFNAGNIIADNIFFDPYTMDANAIQSFLDNKGSKCVAGEMPCLKNYAVATADQPADSLCSGYRGVPTGESAATIIAKVSVSCGISPRVMLVLLQKEQSLVARTKPTRYAYEHATGFSCPDGAACNPAFSGLVSQVYFAARQFQRYAKEPARYNFKAGKVNTIGYYVPYDVVGNPPVNYNNLNNRRCGTAQVFIANQATAGLYNYTPYLPNQAALAAQYSGVPGAPDVNCSSYGNRNFWLYFTDWFGSTQSPVASAVADRYTSLGGPDGFLGSPTGGVACGLAGGGCTQGYANGAIYWSPATGAQVVSGAVRDKWGSLGWENSSLGYPAGDTTCGLNAGGCFQNFQRGSIYWTSGTGAHVMSGGIQSAWNATGWERGPLGYPLTDPACGLRDGGCWQSFQGGPSYWSPATGAHVISGAVGAMWSQTGYERGPLGFPTSDLICGLRLDGCMQTFQYGYGIYSNSATGTHVVAGAIGTAWGAQQWERGPLGYPSAGQVCGLKNGGCFQQFQGGNIYSSPGNGAHAVSGVIATAWAGEQWENGPLGYPTGDQRCGLAGGGCFQTFQGGTYYSTATTGTHAVRGAIAGAWAAQKWEQGPLGYPTGDQVCGLTGGGCSQTFQRGSAYSSPAGGAHLVSGAVLDAWKARGAETGTLGYPTGDQVCGLLSGGCFQLFQGGSIYHTTATGADVVTGVIRTAWAAQGYEKGALGYPTADQTCGLPGGGCGQQFQGGSIYTSTEGGTHAVLGSIATTWSGTGAETGPLGYPTAGQACGLRSAGCFQTFQEGSVYRSSGTGTQAVHGAIYQAWAARGWENGPLGYPTAAQVTTASDVSQQFERGTLAVDTATGEVTQTP